jgi:hypothetical protein
VCMQEVGVDTARSAHETVEQRWNEERQPRAAPQVPEHAVAVGDPVVAVLLGPYDLHVETSRANVIDRVRDEPTRRVTRMARVGRGQHGDAHQLSTRKTA